MTPGFQAGQTFHFPNDEDSQHSDDSQKMVLAGDGDDVSSVHSFEEQMKRLQTT